MLNVKIIFIRKIIKITNSVFTGVLIPTKFEIKKIEPGKTDIKINIMLVSIQVSAYLKSIYFFLIIVITNIKNNAAPKNNMYINFILTKSPH